MNCNFSISKGCIFTVGINVVDIQQYYEFSSFKYEIFGEKHVNILWNRFESNQNISFTSRSVQDFIVKGCDPSYPFDSSMQLKVAGFSDGNVSMFDDNLNVIWSIECPYFTIALNDGSAIFIKAHELNMIEL